MRKLAPRRFTDTPMRSSMSRRFSSSGPQRFASRALSGGARSNSRAVSTGAGVDIGSTVDGAARVAAIFQIFLGIEPATQRLRQRLHDRHIDEAADQALRSREIHPSVV